MGYLVAMETYVTLFCAVHFLQGTQYRSINVYTNFEINRYKIDEFRKHEKIVYLKNLLMFLMTLTFDICSIGCHTK